MPPHEITVNLGGMYSISQIQYLPRQDLVNGRIKNYQFFLSQNGTDWGQSLAEGIFVNSTSRQLVDVPPTPGRYLRIRILSSVNGEPFGSIAELDLLGVPVTVIANNTPDSIIDFLPDHLTIAPGRSLDFRGFGMDVDSDEPFTFAWDFGRGSGIAPTVSQNPGSARFFIPGQFKVTMAVTDAKGAVDATPDVMKVSVTSDLLDSSHWSLKFADSEETVAYGGAASNAFDGDPRSFWLSRGPAEGKPAPHELQIDLGSSFKLSGLQYIPRQTSSEGRVLNYYLFVSEDGANWGDPSASGTLSDSTSEQIVGFAPVTGRYVSFISTSDFGGAGIAAIGEIGLFGRSSTSGGGSSSEVFSGNITDASEAGRALLTAPDSGAQREALGLDSVGVKTLYENSTAVVSREEAEAGTSDFVRLWTAERVGQAIAALSPAFSEAGNYTLTGSWDFSGANVTPSASSSVSSGNIVDASNAGRVILTAPGAAQQREALGVDRVGVKTLYEEITGVVSREEAEAGSSDVVRLWTAERVRQAIASLSPGFSESGDYALTGSWDFTLANVAVGVPSGNITDASAVGRVLLSAPDAAAQRSALGLDGVGVKTLYENASEVVSLEEAEAGASDIVRMWTAERVGQAIAALSPGFSESGDYTLTGNWDFTGANVTVGATSSVVSSNITDATAAGRLILTAPDAAAQRGSIGLDGAGVKTLYESASGIVSQEDAEAGTSDVIRMWTAERVRQAIAALSPAFSESGDYALTGSWDFSLANVAVGVPSGNITDASVIGRVLLTAPDAVAQREALGLDSVGIKTLYETAAEIVSQEDAEAGTSDVVRTWTPERVGQAIAALSPGFLESGDYTLTGNWDFTGANIIGGTTSSVVSSNITDATTAGRLILTAPDAAAQLDALGLDGVRVKTLYESASEIVSQEDAEAGTSDQVRMWTPERVGQAITALSPGFSESGDYTLTGSWDFTSANVAVGVPSGNITDSSVAGRVLLTAPGVVAQRVALGLDGAGVKTLYESASEIVSREDAEAGSSNVVRMWTPERVGQAIAAMAPAGACTGCKQTFMLTVENIENGMNYGIGKVSGSGSPGSFKVEEITAVHVGANLAAPQVALSIFHGSARNGAGTLLLPGVLAVTSTTSGTSAGGLDQLAPIPIGSWIWIKTSGLAGVTGNLEISISGRHVHD